MSLVELSSEERKGIAEHIVACTYTRKSFADMNCGILRKMNFNATVRKAAHQWDPDEPEWVVYYEGQEGGAEWWSSLNSALLPGLEMARSNGGPGSGTVRSTSRMAM